MSLICEFSFIVSQSSSGMVSSCKADSYGSSSSDSSKPERISLVILVKAEPRAGAPIPGDTGSKELWTKNCVVAIDAL